MTKAERLQHAQENAEANLQHMATWPHRKLAERLETVHVQLQIAVEKKDAAAVALLEEWRSQLIHARVYKYENNVADQPSEIEQAIADIEVMETRAEERHEAFEPDQPSVSVRRKTTAPVEDTQLGLF